MIGTIRKHSAWLWAIIILATVASFVIAYRPGGGLGGNTGSGTANLGHIYDTPIDPRDFANAHNEVMIRFYLANGDWPDSKRLQDSNFNVERETYFRLFLMHKANEMHIHAGEEEVSAEAREAVKNLARGEMVKLDLLEAQWLKPRSLTLEDFRRTLEHNIEIQQIYMLQASSGALVTPQEARNLYVRANTEASAQVVFFSLSNYLAQVVVMPEAVSQFYSNQMAAYRLPERVQVTYVEFPLTNYWADAAAELAKSNNVIDKNIEGYMLEKGTNYFGGATNPAQARALLRTRYQEMQAGNFAAKAANAFATEVYDKNTTVVALAQQQGLTIKLTEPFDSRNGPTNLANPMQFTAAAFRLTEQEPNSAPVADEQGIYVMSLVRRIPSEVPTFAAIRDHVVSDYTHYQAMILARQATMESYRSITNDIASGKSFQTACVNARLQPVLVPPFSLRSETNAPNIESHVRMDLLKQAAFSVLPGQALFTGTDEGGMILYLNARLPVNQAQMDAEFPTYLARVRQARESEAFNAWFSREASTALRDVTALQQKQNPGLQ